MKTVLFKISKTNNPSKILFFKNGPNQFLEGLIKYSLKI